MSTNEKSNQNLPRPEYPRPQFVREEWLNLNGPWEFEVDQGDSGFERKLLERPLSDEILVPFCPESKLSGVENTDFLEAVWYRRIVEVPASWKGKRVLLHFQACDYDTTVWVKVNGASEHVEVGRHRGGFTPFTCNLNGLVEGGDSIEIVVRARDPHEPPQPRGKQSQRYENYDCFYTRTTGIWQTVWMEPVPRTHLRRPHITPDITKGAFRIEQRVMNPRHEIRLRATLRDERGVVSIAEEVIDSEFISHLELTVPEDRRRLWSPRDPHLYDLDVELFDETGGLVDKAYSYAGLRAISIEGQSIKLNGEVLFQRLVLDQGYYPDGVMTAPTDEDLKRDIQLSLDAGFNGARLHQKVFEERFLYHADKMGYLCWSEFPDWGCRGLWPDENRMFHGITYAAQWMEAVERDYSHPCIIGWCPLNETYQELRNGITELDDAARAMYLVTKAADMTRPVLDASGYSHRVPATDVYDSHDYEQNPIKFRAHHAGLAEGKPFINGPLNRPWNIVYRNQPFFVSEFGGIWWNPADHTEQYVSSEEEGKTESWGYGARPRSVKEFMARFKGLCEVLLRNPHMFGYCYTQLTDVYQEQNGIYTFDRKPKFDIENIKKIQQQPAAIEKLNSK
jgi:beta-galactosidase/beta-glucuronidase